MPLLGRVEGEAKDSSLQPARDWVISRLTYNHGQYPLRMVVGPVFNPFSLAYKHKPILITKISQESCSDMLLRPVLLVLFFSHLID